MKLHVRSMLFRSPRSKLLAAVASFAAIALVRTDPAGDGRAAADVGIDEHAAGRPACSGSHLGSAGQPEVPRAERRREGICRPRHDAVDLEPADAGWRCPVSPSCRISAHPNNAIPGFFERRDRGRRTREGNGQPCGKIDPGQSLTMNLGSGLAGKMIDYAEIDLELKFGGAVTVTGYIVQGTTATPVVDGDLHVDRLGLGSRLRRSRQLSGPVPEERQRRRSTASSSASDPRGADRSRAEPTAQAPAMRRMRTNAAGTEASASGKTLGTTDTLFHLLEVDGVLDCGRPPRPRVVAAPRLNS